MKFMLAERVVATVLADLRSRGWLSDIAAADVATMRAEWITQVQATLRICPFCNRERLGAPLCGVCDNDD